MSKIMLSTTGEFYDPFRLSANEIDIHFISRCLSNISRFGGDANVFYSVAQHSCRVAKAMPTIDLAFIGLLHDAPEAYIGDMPTPIKEKMVEFQRLEFAIWTAIARRYFLPIELPPEIKLADKQVLWTEWSEYKTAQPPAEWIYKGWEPLPKEKALAPPAARLEFTHMFNTLYHRRRSGYGSETNPFRY